MQEQLGAKLQADPAILQVPVLALAPALALGLEPGRQATVMVP